MSTSNASTRSSEDAGASGFQNLGLSDQTLEVLSAIGYSDPTPIQGAAIPVLLKGNDVIAQAATGTGKTAAFALPIIEQLGAALNNGEIVKHKPAAIVLAPTRELAIQVSSAFEQLSGATELRTVAIYGGQSIGIQAGALKKGANIVVATPGRAVDLIERGLLKLDAVRFVVLDEADEMLDMGFAEELDRVLDEVPQEKQTALFSATMPPRLRKIAGSKMNNPQNVVVERARDENGLESNIHHVVYLVDRQHKIAALGRVLDFESPRAALVFGRSRDQVDELADEMNRRGYRAEALHGGMSQEQRDKVMNRLRKGLTNLLVATDVAARGLDIDHLTHVVNFDIPMQAETYVHRSGRVGRGDRNGVSITIGGRNDRRKVSMLEKAVGKRFEFAKLPTASSLRERQMDRTRARVSDAIIAGDASAYESMLSSLADEFSVEKLALGALKLIHESAFSGDLEDIPDASESFDKSRGRDGRDGGRGNRFERGGRDGGRGGDRGGRDSRGGGQGGPRDARMAGLYISVGRDGGVRPKDLVGAIANEAGIRGTDIGNIDIAPRFSIVDVPKNQVDSVIRAMRNTTIKGRKITVRRDRER